MIGHFTSPDSEFAISTLKKGEDSLRRAAAVLHQPDLAKYVRSVHICRVGEGRTVPHHYHVPRQILEDFARLLTHAQHVTQIWYAKSSNLNSRLTRQKDCIANRYNP